MAEGTSYCLANGHTVSVSDSFEKYFFYLYNYSL
jgi:hypothetical protein